MLSAKSFSMFSYLQSTMVRLRLIPRRLFPKDHEFTIHYGEIKTAMVIALPVSGVYLQSTMVRLRRC